MTERQPSRRSNRPYLTGLLTGVTASFLAYSLFLSPGEESQSENPEPAVPADSVPNTCPSGNVEVKSESDLQPIELAIDDIELDMYTELLANAESFDAVKNNLDQIFSRWDYTIYIGEVPILSDQDLATRGNDVEHTPEQITQSLLNISAIHIIESLRSIPEPLMSMTSGTDIYLTMGMTGESGGYAGLYAKDENSRPLMIIGIGPNDPSGEIFEHELTHNLFFRLCGDNIGYNDNELAEFNPDGWLYTRSEVSDLYWYEVTSSRYGATNTAEDIAEAFPKLLVTPLGRICIRDESGAAYTTPLCNKWDLLLRRIAAVSPDTANYLARY